MRVNAALVVAVLRILPSDVDMNAVQSAVARPCLPGRMQVISANDKILLFDGAHNVALRRISLPPSSSFMVRRKHNVHAVVAHTGTHDGVGFAAALPRRYPVWSSR